MAFKSHFEEIQRSYKNQKQVVVINLVEEFGRESVLGDAFMELVSELDNENIVYVQFDFHEYWLQRFVID